MATIQITTPPAKEQQQETTCKHQQCPSPIVMTKESDGSNNNVLMTLTIAPSAAM